MACKYKYKDNWYSEEEVLNLLRKENSSFTTLYNNLLKELETSETGRKVFEQVKRDYVNKEFKDFDDIVDISKDFKIVPDAGDTDKGKYYLTNDDGENFGNYNLEEIVNKFPEYFKPTAYTLEEQQEEAIVSLISILAAGKLEEKENATLKKKLLEFWKQISDFVRSLLRQDGIKIDELPISTTLNDLAKIMAYGNNKIILPGYKIEYSTTLGNKYDTLEEVNNEIKEIIALFKDLKLEDIDFKVEVDNNKRVAIIIKPNGERIESYKLYEFIQKDKEYAQTREIIEEYKKENNIQYDPEEVYSRGQEFYHIHNAYSRNHVDTELWIQNLLETIQDKAKIGAKVEMSFATAPKGEVGKGLQHHNKETKQTVYITSYPKSEDIEFVSQIDNHTSSFTDLTVDMIKVFTNQKNERVGIALTKSVPLSNLHTIQPNLATTIDDVAHHNEIVIGLTPYNFRISYEENVPYETKKLIDNFNKILDDKYGKLVKPEIRKEVIESEEVYELQWKNGNVIGRYNSLEAAKKAQVGEYTDSNGNKISAEEATEIVKGQPIEKIGKQPTQTKENTTSIESVKDNIIGFSKKDQTQLDYLIRLDERNEITTDQEIELKELKNKKKNTPQKEYTSQAETNLKIAALKEVARKYPRSLITSKVVPINPNMVDNSEIQYSKTNNNTEQQTPEDLLTKMIDSGAIQKDCTGGFKAKDGIRGKFTKGSQWEIYEIFEGKSHKQGGIDINIKNNQISFTNKNGSIKAKYGLVISKDN